MPLERESERDLPNCISEEKKGIKRKFSFHHELGFPIDAWKDRFSLKGRAANFQAISERNVDKGFPDEAEKGDPQSLNQKKRGKRKKELKVKAGTYLKTKVKVKFQKVSPRRRP